MRACPVGPGSPGGALRRPPAPCVQPYESSGHAETTIPLERPPKRQGSWGRGGSHNYLRMPGGRKILSGRRILPGGPRGESGAEQPLWPWTAGTPTHRAGISGCWSLRPGLAERPVYGTVRSMTAPSTRRKVSWRDTWSVEGGDGGAFGRSFSGPESGPRRTSAGSSSPYDQLLAAPDGPPLPGGSLHLGNRPGGDHRQGSRRPLSRSEAGVWSWPICGTRPGQGPPGGGGAATWPGPPDTGTSPPGEAGHRPVGPLRVMEPGERESGWELEPLVRTGGMSSFPHEGDG